jgi:hypothetical protein
MSKNVESEVELFHDMAFRARSGSGYDVLLGASKEGGGAGSGLRPIELALLGLGGCTGMEVIGILRKMRQDVTDYLWGRENVVGSARWGCSPIATSSCGPSRRARTPPSPRCAAP